VWKCGCLSALYFEGQIFSKNFSHVENLIIQADNSLLDPEFPVLSRIIRHRIINSIHVSHEDKTDATC
jgi:hypothetical protein